MVEKKRIVYYDILRIISIFSIIVLHVARNTIYTSGLQGMPATIYNLIAQIAYFAVPLFIMISGGLFLNPEKEIDIKKLYKKYISRILICLFGFGIMYSMIEIYFNTRKFNVLYMLTESVKNIFTGNLWAHMWFLYLILGLYIISPLLRVFTKNCTQTQYKYILLILFIFDILLVDITKLLHVNIAFDILIVNPYILLYLLGYYLSKYDISKKKRGILYACAVLALIFLIINNFVSILPYEYFEYTSLAIFVITVSLFVLFKHLKHNFGEKSKLLLQNIGECCFGVYLIHQLVINIIYKLLKLNIIVTYPYIGLIIYSIFIFLISLGITYILRKIKFVKKYIL